MQRKTILVVDDQNEFAEYVRHFLELDGFDVIVASNGTTGLSIAKKHRPDLVVLDLTMPDIDGLQVCSQLRADPRRAKLPILLLSARSSSRDRVLGLNTGADDYLVKPFDPQELVARVRALLRRSDPDRSTRATINSGDLVIDLHARQVLLRGQPIHLTAAQMRILEVLALRAGQVLSRDEIIEAALQEDADITERTVDAHIAGIRKAIGSAAGCLETVRSFGYLFRGDQTIE